MKKEDFSKIGVCSDSLFHR